MLALLLQVLDNSTDNTHCSFMLSCSTTLLWCQMCELQYEYVICYTLICWKPQMYCLMFHHPNLMNFALWLACSYRCFQCCQGLETTMQEIYPLFPFPPFFPFSRLPLPSRFLLSPSPSPPLSTLPSSCLPSP